MVRRRIWRLNDDEENVGDEHLNLGLEVVPEVSNDWHKEAQGQRYNLGHVGCVVLEERDAKIVPNCELEPVPFNQAIRDVLRSQRPQPTTCERIGPTTIS